MPKREVQDFISHWSAASPSERANSQPFLIELCDLLDVPRPDPHPANGYFFEFPVEEHHPDGTTSIGRIDLYRRACFVLESKQFQEAKAKASQLELAAEETGLFSRKKSSQPVRGTEAWDEAMIKARGQAERYIRAIPDDNPPFIIVVDVGHSFELFEDFSQAGKTYRPFPDPRTFRIRLADLADEKIRERLRLIWTNPAALDPSKHSADVTREVSGHLAELAKSLELAGHEPDIVAQFLTRCLFCMFAEDVELLPKNSFTELLESLPATGEGFVQKIRTLFEEMQKGTDYSVVLNRKLLRFNGGLFENCSVLPINGLQLSLLKEAARQNWGNVEPAIFGTLLERALNPDERHQLGAHFTPRAYVERLVLPTVIEPLRAEWEHVRAAVLTQARAGNLKKARAEVNAFHEKLCRLVVLDPACGVGNFLYVSLQHLKILEGEVLDFAAQFGDTFKLELATNTIDPHQFLGLEINPRAAAIAELVLWIGYLQWHFKLHGKRTPPEPILRAFKNIQCRDAVLKYDGEPQPARDQAGKEITVWDRRSKKTDMVTGREVPDETKRVPLLTYANPKPAEWPQADFIVGNPPYIGARTMRPALDDGYIDALRATYPEIPENADLVMYWWHKAAELVRASKVKRFGLITTNSLRQSFNRQVTEVQLSARPPLSLAFAVPDHPWVDTADGAAVRIAMTVGIAGNHSGELLEVTGEETQHDGSEIISFKSQVGKIQPDIRIGAELSSTKALVANAPFCCVGYQLTGTGFVLTRDEKNELSKSENKVIAPLLSARDITQESRDLFAIDLFGWSVEAVRQTLPAVYQRILTRVKPERDANARASVRDRWWIYGEARSTFRPALADLKRAIVTPLTAKHRPFVFCDVKTVADSTTVLFALDDAFHLGVLSSRIHVTFSLAAGGRLGVGNDPRYNKSDCFDPFPFPICGEAKKNSVRKLAEELDAHRKRVQAQHGLTLTGLYNVLEKIRTGEKLTDKEKVIHDAGLVSVLKQLHDDLDAAVFAAYGWPATLTDAEILERLVALNAERAAEEKRGIVHWLRPEYQAKGQAEMILPAGQDKPAKKAKTKTAAPARASKSAWPKKMAERVQAVEAALHHFGAAATPGDLAKLFKRAEPADVAEILETLVTLGRARKQGGKYSR
ncbi:MAG TPA: DNA methyltransferase [Verrucomicrobiae bacterium]